MDGLLFRRFLYTTCILYSRAQSLSLEQLWWYSCVQSTCCGSAMQYLPCISCFVLVIVVLQITMSFELYYVC